MSNFDNKTTRSVADIVANIMSEKLHPNQQKLDVVDDEKIDGKDFAKLRAMKKEETEQLKEYESKNGSYTHKGTYGYAGKGAEHGDTDYAKENELAKAADKPKKPARGKYGARQNFKRSTRVNEGFSSMFDALQEKGLKGLAEAMSHAGKTTMKHVEKSDAPQQVKDAIKKAAPDIKSYKDRADALTAAGIKREEVEDLNESDIENGYKIRMKHIDKGRIHSPSGEHVATVTREHGEGWRYHSGNKNWDGLETSKHYKTGVEKTKAAAAKKAVQAHMNEEVEDLNESDIGNGYKIKMKHTDKGRIHSPSGEHVADVTKHESGWQYHSGGKNWDGSETSKHYKTGVEKTKMAAAKKASQIHMNEEVDNDTYAKEVADQKAKFDGKKKGADVAKPSVQAVQQEETHTTVEVIDLNDVNGVQMSTIELDEREMTDAEMAKREKNVKSMKKNLQGFKERYGKDAKSVMYATATKQAMKEETESEHYKAGHEYASDHAQDSGFKVTARARKKEMLADNPHKKGTTEHADWHKGALDGHQTALDNM